MIQILYAVHHSLSNRKIYLIASLFTSILGFYACSEPNKNNRDFIITDCSKDTSIKLNNLRGQYAARRISLKIDGSIDDSAELIINDDTEGVDKDKAGLMYFPLTKGNLKLRNKVEIYSQDYELVYLHKSAKKGMLKIKLQLLSPNGDTLRDGE